MSARVSLKPRRSQSALPTARVSHIRVIYGGAVRLTITVDANLFKEAFIKAQQENETLFNKDGAKKTEETKETKE